MLYAGHIDATDEQVGHLVTFVSRIDLPIDADWDNTGNSARDDDAFRIGLTSQHLEAITTEVSKECGIDDDDVVLVPVGILLPLSMLRFSG